MRTNPLSWSIGLALGISALGPSLPLAAETSHDGTLLVTHTVEQGDTLSALALRYYGNAGRFRTIFEANLEQLDHPDRIYPGQNLRVPDPVSAPSPTPQEPEHPTPRAIQGRDDPQPEHTSEENQASHKDEPLGQRQHTSGEGPERSDLAPSEHIDDPQTREIADTHEDATPPAAGLSATAEDDKLSVLEAENTQLREHIQHLSDENRSLTEQIQHLQSQLSAALDSPGSASALDSSDPPKDQYTFRAPIESELGARLNRQAAQALNDGDSAEAVRLFLLAAAEANPDAMNALGNLYLRGIGTIPSAREAYIWYLRGSELGHTSAMENLARLYETGHGVRQNQAKADIWRARKAKVLEGSSSSD